MHVECARLQAQSDELSARMASMQEALAVWPAKLMAQAGCLVYVGNDGAPAVRYGLVRPDDREALVHAARNGESTGSGWVTALASLPAAKTRAVHSEKLVRYLTAHRLAAIQAELLDRFDVALAVLTAQMAKELLLDDYRQPYGCEDPLTLTVGDTHACLRADAEDVEDSAAWQSLNAQRIQWQGVPPAEGPRVLPWVVTQGPDTVHQLFAFLVAITVTGVYATEQAQQRKDGPAVTLGLDMTKWWLATATSYFQHRSKARSAEVVGEATGIQPNATMQPLKKDASVAYAEQAVAGKGWLPTLLRVHGVDDRLAASHSAKAPEGGAQDDESEDVCPGGQAEPAYVASAVKRCGNPADDGCAVED